MDDPGRLIYRKIGGASLPGLLLRINGTFPFGVLEIYEREVRLRLWMGLWGAPLRARPEDLELVFPVRALFRRGIGFRAPDGTEHYFWTFQTQRPLSVLARLGFPVTDRPETASPLSRKL